MFHPSDNGKQNLPTADDPRLTAYALGELDAKEVASVEALLAQDADARKLVEETRCTAATLRMDLKGEAARDLQVAPKSPVVLPLLPAKQVSRLPWGWVGLVACLLVALVLRFSIVNTNDQVAQERVVESFRSARGGQDATAIRDLETGASVPASSTSKVSVDTTAKIVTVHAATLADHNEATDLFKNRIPSSSGGGAVGTDGELGGCYSCGSSYFIALAIPGPANNPQRIPFALEELRHFSGVRGKDFNEIKGLLLRQQGAVQCATDPAAKQKAKHELDQTLAKLNIIQSQEREHNTEAYDRIVDNPFLTVGENPLSTFSIDVDTASYSNMRRFLTEGRLPPKDSVRIEELLNYFSYDYAPPNDSTPFSANVEVAECPWAPEHRLVRVGLKGREIANEQRPSSNLVFLIDVSGSMLETRKLPLVQQGLRLLVEQLGENDRVAIVVYAGASGLVLPSTTCDRKDEIKGVLGRLQAGGSTNGGEGIELAYKTAAAGFIKGGTNRVILCTDGDWNVGVTNQGDLTRLIEEKAKGGVFLSVLGFGMGNYKDSTLEKLADKGNGNYAYIDTLNEARKVLVDQMTGTLITIAKDVKIQIEFNPVLAGAYRLIGYENRLLAKEDFNDDQKDAGEIGAGHTVTALYEVVPAEKHNESPAVDPLKYQEPLRYTKESRSGELLTLKLRYKAPDGDTSSLLEFPVKDDGKVWAKSSKDFRFAASVASFGMVLRASPHKGLSNYALAHELAQESVGADKSGYRAEFLELIQKAKQLDGK